jgi:septum site-determining protein MinC
MDLSEMEIKGIKDGILVHLDQADWDRAKPELIKQIKQNQSFFQGARLFIDVGDTILKAKELGELRDNLSDQGIVLTGVLSLSNITRETAQLLGLKTTIDKPKPQKPSSIAPLDTLLKGESAVLLHRTMRSGHKVSYHGHVVVLGDVNPGAEIIASGCIVVWGRLRGTVHAGAEGDEDVVVCALDLSPMQLRIGSKIAITPQDQEKPQPEIARIKGNQIVAETWQHHRGDL